MWVAVEEELLFCSPYFSTVLFALAKYPKAPIRDNFPQKQNSALLHIDRQQRSEFNQKMHTKFIKKVEVAKFGESAPSSQESRVRNTVHFLEVLVQVFATEWSCCHQEEGRCSVHNWTLAWKETSTNLGYQHKSLDVSTLFHKELYLKKYIYVFPANVINMDLFYFLI